MKVIAINGSPRKKWNTATLLEKALEGAASEGAETELIHLYDLNYQGCTSCFACKLKDGKSYGKCAMNDELTHVLTKLKDADAVILGSPIYLGNCTGEMRSFLERYIFPYLVYSANSVSLYPKNIPIGYIYTMNIKEEYFVSSPNVRLLLIVFTIESHSLTSD
jgi:multimeric flavodoxin WrbA